MYEYENKNENREEQIHYPVVLQTKKAPKRGFAKGGLLFLCGALVMGSLMFASDKMNLFSNDHASVTKAVAANNKNLENVSQLAVSRPDNIAQMVEKTGPAVVKIETYGTQDTSPMDSFFGRDQTQDEEASGLGSGFIFDSSGYILTNEHVIDGASKITVTVQGYDTPFVAEKLGSSYELDLAVLKIEGKEPFSSLSLGNSDQMKVGDWVVAIGNPYGFDHTTTIGVLSAKERPISIAGENGAATRNYEHLFQTDASINPGNSGGPLLNTSGQVIGINTAVNSEAQGIGFAIPTSTISSVLENLKNNIALPNPYIGVMIRDMDEGIASQIESNLSTGAIVVQVEKEGPADLAGIKAYDIITKVNDTTIVTSSDFVKAVKTKKAGDKITVELYRDGKSYDVAVLVADKK